LAIMPERIRTLDALLTELNRSPVCDRVVLPLGVRYLFNLDGTVVKSVEELVDGGNYVCASTNRLRQLAYLSIVGPIWNNSARPSEGGFNKGGDIAVYGKPISELRSVTYRMGSHSFTCHSTQMNVPRFNPRPALDLLTPEGWKAELT